MGAAGTASATLRPLSAAASGTHGYVCSVLATLRPISVSGAGTHGVVGSASASLPAFSASAAGEFGAPDPREGVGVATLRALTARAVGEHDGASTYAGAGGVPFPRMPRQGISRGVDDDRDLLEMLPIVIGVIQHAGR